MKIDKLDSINIIDRIENRIKFDKLQLYNYFLLRNKHLIICERYNSITKSIIKINNLKYSKYEMVLKNITNVENNIQKKNKINYLLKNDILEFKKFINFKKTDNTLLITNNYSNQNYFSLMGINQDCLLFENKEYLNEENTQMLEEMKSKNINFKGSFLKSDMENFNNEIFDNKYDKIILRESEFLFELYYENYKLTTIPNFILMLTKGLQFIKEGGDLYLFTRVMYLTKTHKKMLYLLANNFSNIKIESFNLDQNDIILIKCTGFKNNITKQMMNKLIKIIEETRPYNYSVEQYLNYFYHVSKTNPKDNNFMYPLDITKLDLPKNIKSTQKTMEIVTDIPINPPKSKLGESIILQLETLYEQYITTTNFNITRYISTNNRGELEADKDFFEKLIYDKIFMMIKTFEENKIPYNKTYLAYIKEYNKSIVDQLFSLKDAPVFRVVKYNNLISNKTIYKLTKNKGFHYPEIEESLELVSLASKVKNNMLVNIDYSKYKTVKATTEDFARGVSQYLKKTYELSRPVSNAYLKLWEIYILVPSLIPNKKVVRVFHMAEAPGNWINSTASFIAVKRNKVEQYDWRANSLNPKSPINKAKYTQEIFSDDYGFMRKYKDRWLFGADDTGDITSTKNIKWFKKYLDSWCDKQKLDLITGDAGLSVSDANLEFLQKLDIAQMIMVAYLSNIGGNCVIKHFTPFLNTKPGSYQASGYFISYLFMYYLMFNEVRIIKPHTSNPNSGEFYIVGLKFKGVDDTIKNKLLSILSNFKENEAFFLEKDIPEEFSMQIINFIKIMNEKRVQQFDVQNMLLTCIIDKDPVIEKATNCRKYLNKDYISKLQDSRFKEWIKMYKFEQ